MEIGRILPTEAAVILKVSPQFIRIAMQREKLPIGTAIKMSSIWTYHISEKLLKEYSGKDVEKELEKIRGGQWNEQKGKISDICEDLRKSRARGNQTGRPHGCIDGH